MKIIIIAILASITLSHGDLTAYRFINQNDNRDVQVFDLENGRYYNESGHLFFSLSVCNRGATCYFIEDGLTFFYDCGNLNFSFCSDGRQFRNLGIGALNIWNQKLSGSIILYNSGETNILYFYSTSLGLLAQEQQWNSERFCNTLESCEAILNDGEQAYLAERAGFLAFQ